MKDLLNFYKDTIVSAGKAEQPKGQHVLNMLDHIPSMTNDTDKMNRWLGFVQGYLWAQNIFSVDQLREQTRKVVATKVVEIPHETGSD